MLLVNFIGEPGAGKTTLAAGVLHALKMRGIDVEMIPEYSKELISFGDSRTLSDELQVFSEKYKRIQRFADVDVVLTDSPLINSVVYGGEQFQPEASAFYKRVADSFLSVYVIVERIVPYDPRGRMPNEEKAVQAGQKLISLVEDEYLTMKVKGEPTSINEVAAFIVKHAG